MQWWHLYAKKASDPYNTTKYHQHNHKRYNNNLAFQKGEAKQNDIIRSNLHITINSLNSLSFYHSSPLSIEKARKKRMSNHTDTHTHTKEKILSLNLKATIVIALILVYQCQSHIRKMKKIDWKFKRLFE